MTAWYHHSDYRRQLCDTPYEGYGQGCGAQGERPIAWLGCVSATGFQMHGLCQKIPAEDKP